MLKRIILALISALIVGGSAANAQELIQNPDFALNSFGTTQFNLNNAAVTGGIAFCTGYGGAQEFDLAYNADWGPMPPVGNTKLGLHTQATGIVDAFSHTLASNLVAGGQYRLRYYLGGFGGGGNSPMGTGIGRIQIGVSTSATSFGTQVFASDVTDAWSFVDVTFSAPNSGGFLTVQSDSTRLSTYAFVTGFSLMGTGAKVSSMNASPREIRYGQRSYITVTLDRAAPPGGQVVMINYSANAVDGPFWVRVPAGRRSLQFYVIGRNRANVVRRVDITGRIGTSSAATWVLSKP